MKDAMNLNNEIDIQKNELNLVA